MDEQGRPKKIGELNKLIDEGVLTPNFTTFTFDIDEEQLERMAEAVKAVKASLAELGMQVPTILRPMPWDRELPADAWTPLSYRVANDWLNESGIREITEMESLSVGLMPRYRSILDDDRLSPEDQEAIADLISTHIRRITEAALLGRSLDDAPDPEDAYTHTGDEDPYPPLTIDDGPLAGLEKAVAELREKVGRIPVEIWFVDCRDVYLSFISELREHTHMQDVHDRYLTVFPGIGSIPIIQWYMENFDPETEAIADREDDAAERARLRAARGLERVWPWFVKEPGIWVRYNDDSARRIGPDLSTLMGQQEDGGTH